MKNSFKSSNILKGLGIALIITFILLFIEALLIKFTSIRESKMVLLNNFVLILSVVISSALLGRHVKERGWLNGAILGFLYYLIIILMNLLFNKPFNFSIFLLFRLGISVILGAIGGMIGINLH